MNRPMVRFVGYGFSMSVIVGTVIAKMGGAPSRLEILVLAAGCTYLAALFSGVSILRKPKSAQPVLPAEVPEAPEGSVPRYNSRRWARACFHSGIISIEELNAFYASHPADPRDPDR